MRKYIITIVFTILIGVVTYAQQELILTKYTFNSLFFNPAYAGSHGDRIGSAVLQYRKQWLGYEGAPNTLMAGVESSISKDRVGIGLVIGQDQIGIDKRSDVYGNYAYKFDAGPGKMSLGIRFGGSFFSSALSDLKNVNINDPKYISNPSFSVWSAGFGAYWNNENGYVGFSIPTLFNVNKKAKDFLKRHFYFQTGLVIGGDYSDIEFEPSVLLKYEPTVPLQFTFGLNAWYKRKFAVGLAYRTDDAIAILFEILLDQRYRLSVAYDFTLSKIRKHSSGTPEIMLGYNFSTDPSNKKIKNIRHRGLF